MIMLANYLKILHSFPKWTTEIIIDTTVVGEGQHGGNH
jgi:hypothetical protein